MPRTRVKRPSSKKGPSPGNRSATKTSSRTNQRRTAAATRSEERVSGDEMEESVESVIEESVEETPTKVPIRTLNRTRSPSKRRKSKPVIVPVSGDKTLFEIVKEGSTSLSAVVSGWIDSYESDRDIAATEFIQFIIHCSGCQGTVTIEMLHEDMTECIMALTKEFSGGVYPLMSHSNAFRGLKSNVSELVERFVKESHHRGILFDEYLMTTVVMPWVTTLSASQVRPFRHAATLVAMKITTALTAVLSEIEEEINKSQVQLGTESRKSRGHRGSRKVETLEDTMEELKEHVEEVKEMIQQLVTSVFTLRYRDVKPEIRAMCMTEIGEWMDKNRSLFIHDEYLRYLGWCLHDSSADVRLCVVQSLITVYSNSVNKENLKLFTSRFKTRVIGMATDKDVNVAQHTIRLVEMMLQYEQLSAEDVESVYQLVFCTSRVVSHAAGEFLVHRLLSDEQLEAKREEIGEEISESELHLIQLLEYFTEAGLHQHTEFYVDSLWSHCPALKEWDTMTDMLLSDERMLSEEQERVLLDMMASCAMRAAGRPPPTQRQQKRPLLTKERKAIEADCRKMSSCMTAVLPELMSKFGTDDENVQSLISVAKSLDLTRYTELRRETDMESFMNELAAAVMNGRDEKLLYESAELFQYFASSESAVHTTAETALSTLQDKLVANFKDVMSKVTGEPDDALHVMDDESSFSLSCCVRRLTAFLRLTVLPSTSQLVFDMSQFDLFDDINEIVAGYCKDSESVSSELVVPASTALFAIVTRETQNIKDKSVKSKTTMSLLKRRIELLGSHYDNLLQTLDDVELQTQILILFAEFLIAFGQHLRMKGLSSLVYVSSEATQVRLLQLACNHVFTAAEDAEKQDELHESELLDVKRRVLGAVIKLVIYQVVDMRYAVPIFAECLNHKTGLSDLIKMFMTKCREMDKQYYVDSLLQALRQHFEMQMDNSSGEIDVSSQSWKSLKEMAHHFALTCGPDLIKIREPMVRLHHKGIEYSLSKELGHSQRYASDDRSAPPPNLLFFDLLAKFTFKLIKIDKAGPKGILGYLDRQMSQEMVNQIEDPDFRPLREYRANLLAAQQQEGEKDKPKKQLKGAGRSKRKRSNDGEKENGTEQQTVQAEDGETPNGWLHRRDVPSVKKKPTTKGKKDGKKGVKRGRGDSSSVAKRRKVSEKRYNGVNETIPEIDSSLFEKSRISVGEELDRLPGSSVDTPTKRQRRASGESSESELDLLESDVGSLSGSPIKIPSPLKKTARKKKASPQRASPRKASPRKASPQRRSRRSYKPLPNLFDEPEPKSDEEESDSELAKAFD